MRFIYSFFFFKKNHYRNKILYSKPSNKAYDTSRKKYTTDENGFYVYTGNSNSNYSTLYKTNRNPLLEKYNKEYSSPKISKSKNFYENLSKNENIILSPNINNAPQATYNLESNDEYNMNNINDLNNINDVKENKLSLSPMQLSAADSLNDTNQSLKRTKSFNSYLARNNLNSFDEKLKLMKKISQLNCELSNARSNIDQKLDILHDHLHNYNEANKKEMIELNYKNINEINIISSQKDTLIKHLKDVMNDQEETIQKLLKKKTKNRR